jgi:hypothetical protein
VFKQKREGVTKTSGLNGKMFNNWIISIYIYIIILSEKNWELGSLIRGDEFLCYRIVVGFKQWEGERGIYIKGDKCSLMNENKISLILKRRLIYQRWDRYPWLWHRWFRNQTGDWIPWLKGTVTVLALLLTFI